jgi:Bacteriophage HK97-gp10, putative tail-component
MAGFNLRGIREAQSDLKRLAGDAPKIIAPILTDALQPMADQIKGNAPQRTGRLANSIEVIELDPRASSASSEVVIPVDYAAHRDLGTSHLAPAHFVEDAYDSLAQAVAKKAIDKITKTLT